MTNNQHDLLEQISTLKKELHFAQNEIVSLQQLIETKNEQLEIDIQENTRVLKELRLSEFIVERSPVILFRRRAGMRINDEDPPLEYISQNIKQFGYTPEEFLNGEIEYSDIVYPGDHAQINEIINNYADTDAEEYTMVYRCVTKNGDIRWVEDQTMVVRDKNGKKTHNQGIIIDITERKLAEDQLRKSEEKFRRIVETAVEGFVLMDNDFKIVDLNHSFCAMLGYKNNEILGKTLFDIASNDFKVILNSQWENIKKIEMRNFEARLVGKDKKNVPVLIHGNPLRDDNGKIIGNMSFITDMTKHKKSLILASEVQKSLLPQKQPEVKGFDIAGKNVSCDEIGGDYFDYIWRTIEDENSFGVVVGDISGHGVDSALLMTTARAFLRMRASQPGTITEIISAMNLHLTQDVLEIDRFMTLFYLNLNLEDHSLSWIRAGHDPALLYDPISDTFEELKGDGIALGLLEKVQYQENFRSGLKNGQIIAIGTDGIWEAFNRQREMFGKKRFKKIIADNAHRNAKDIVDIVCKTLNIFTAGAKTEDDVTLVIIKVDRDQ